MPGTESIEDANKALESIDQANNELPSIHEENASVKKKVDTAPSATTRQEPPSLLLKPTGESNQPLVPSIGDQLKSQLGSASSTSGSDTGKSESPKEVKEDSWSQVIKPQEGESIWNFLGRQLYSEPDPQHPTIAQKFFKPAAEAEWMKPIMDAKLTKEVAQPIAEGINKGTADIAEGSKEFSTDPLHGTLKEITGVGTTLFNAIPAAMEFNAVANTIKSSDNEAVKKAIDIPFTLAHQAAKAIGYNPAQDSNGDLILGILDLATIAAAGAAHEKVANKANNTIVPIQSFAQLKDQTAKVADNTATPEEKEQVKQTLQSMKDVSMDDMVKAGTKSNSPVDKAIIGKIINSDQAPENINPNDQQKHDILYDLITKGEKTPNQVQSELDELKTSGQLSPEDELRGRTMLNSYKNNWDAIKDMGFSEEKNKSILKTSAEIDKMNEVIDNTMPDSPVKSALLDQAKETKSAHEAVLKELLSLNSPEIEQSKTEVPETGTPEKPLEVNGTEVMGHVQDEPTAAKLINDNGPTDLTSKGEKEAAKIGDELNVRRPDVKTIYTSPVKRAVDTAKIVASKIKGSAVKTLDYLKTWNMGEGEGTPESGFNEIKAIENPDKAPFKGADTFNEFKDNAVDAWHKVKDLPKDAIVFTHSKMQKMFKALNLTDGVWNEKAKKEYIRLTEEENHKESESTNKRISEAFKKNLEDKYEDFKQKYKAKYGNIFNTDNAREFSEDYLKSPETMSDATQIPARDFVNKMYKEELAKEAPKGKKNQVLFTAGGSGVGKTRTVEHVSDTPQIIVDTNFSNFDRAKADVDEALNHNKGVQIAFVYRDPYEAFIHGVVDRMKHAVERGEPGRTVPYKIATSINEKSLKTIQKLAEHYKNDADVNFHYIDNTGEYGKHTDMLLSDLKNITFDKELINKRIKDELDRQYKAGELTEKQFRGLTEGEEKRGTSDTGGQGLNAPSTPPRPKRSPGTGTQGTGRSPKEEVNESGKSKKTNPGGEETEGSKSSSERITQIQAKRSGPGSGTPKSRRQIRNPAALEALKVEPTSPYEEVLQHFISGGKLHPDAIQELFGGSGKSISSELKRRIGLLNKVSGETIEGLAHSLWEQRSEGDERYDTSDYRNAVEEVLTQHNGTKSMIDDILDRHKQRIEDEDYYKGIDNPDEFNDIEDYWHNVDQDEQYRISEINNAQDAEKYISEHPIDNPEPTEIKQTDTLVAAEIKKQIDQTKQEISTARKALEDKRREIDKTLQKDEVDLFGERESDKDKGLFDETERADSSQREKILAPLEKRVTDAVKKLGELHDKLSEEAVKKDNTLFDGSDESLNGKPESLGDTIRRGKLGNDSAFSSLPGFKQVWNTAVEIVARSVEAGESLTKAIQKGIEHIKGSDWHKKLKDEDQVKAIKKFETKMKELPLTEEDKTRVRKQVEKKYDKTENEWLGNKSYTEHEANVTAHNQQEEIKSTVPRKKGEVNIDYKKRWTDVDKAMHVYLDLKAHPEDLGKYYETLKPEQKRIVDLSKNLTEEQKKIADKISEEYKKVGEQALDAGQIKNILENYVSRAWDFKGKPATDIGGFRTSTRHALQRTLSSILEGWSKGHELKIEGATNNLQVLKTEIGQAIENKSFIEKGSKIKTETGDPLFTTSHPEGYAKIENPAFKKWTHIGNLENYSSDEIKSFGARKDVLITPEGSVLQKTDIYAPEKMAKGLNNILGKSKLNELPGVETLTKFSNAVKSTIFLSSLFHHLAFARAHLLAGGEGFFNMKNANPLKAYKTGLKMIQELHPEVKLLMENGMTLGKMQDWDEVVKDGKSKLGEMMDKKNFAPRLRAIANDLYERQNKYLFEKYGAGLKALDGVNYLKKIMKDNPTMSPSDAAKVSARFINQNYGGLNLKMMKRNPTAQHAMRLLLLAGDWTESNLQMAKDAFTKGDQGKFARQMWARTLIRGGAAVTLANLVTALAPEDDNDKRDYAERVKDRYQAAWEAGHLRSLEWDLTPLARSMGGDPNKRYYFSYFGHFSDPVKGLADPVSFLRNKLNPVTGKPVLEAMTGENYKYERFTSLSELLGIDDKGVYKTTSLRGKTPHIAGQDKGGQEAGKLTKQDFTESGPINYKQLPSFTLSQMRGMIPSQVSNLEMLATGENDMFSTITNSIGLGVHVSSEHPKK